MSEWLRGVRFYFSDRDLLGMFKPHFFKLDGHWCFRCEIEAPQMIGEARRFVRELRANEVPPGEVSTEYGD